MPKTEPSAYVPVEIPIGRFQELVQTEMEMEIIRHAYRYMESNKMDHVLDAIFNPEFKYKETGG